LGATPCRFTLRTWDFETIAITRGALSVPTVRSKAMDFVQCRHFVTGDEPRSMAQSEGMGHQVRAARANDLEACLQIVGALPDFFTDDVPATVEGDLQRNGGWVIVEANEIVGFVVVDRRSSRAAEILWIAVEPARRGMGYGTRLLDHVLSVLRDHGTALVEVKTLDRSADYEPYQATNAFYERNGFVQVDCIDEFPDWPPGNPAAIYVTALKTTR
jgi:ribosomal protein S18 acetylase RimI-like enzyme